MVVRLNDIIDKVILNIVSVDDNAMLTNLPSKEEVKNAIFSLNGDDAPGPDGFGGYFFSKLLGNHCKRCIQGSSSIL